MRKTWEFVILIVMILILLSDCAFISREKLPSINFYFPKEDGLPKPTRMFWNIEIWNSDEVEITLSEDINLEKDVMKMKVEKEYYGYHSVFVSNRLNPNTIYYWRYKVKIGDRELTSKIRSFKTNHFKVLKAKVFTDVSENAKIYLPDTDNVVLILNGSINVFDNELNKKETFSVASDIYTYDGSYHNPSLISLKNDYIVLYSDNTIYKFSTENSSLDGSSLEWAYYAGFDVKSVNELDTGEFLIAGYDGEKNQIITTLVSSKGEENWKTYYKSDESIKRVDFLGIYDNYYYLILENDYIASLLYKISLDGKESMLKKIMEYSDTCEYILEKDKILGLQLTTSEFDRSIIAYYFDLNGRKVSEKEIYNILASNTVSGDDGVVKLYKANDILYILGIVHFENYGGSFIFALKNNIEPNSLELMSNRVYIYDIRSLGDGKFILIGKTWSIGEDFEMGEDFIMPEGGLPWVMIVEM